MKPYDWTQPQLLQSKDMQRQSPHCLISLLPQEGKNWRNFDFEWPTMHLWKLNFNHEDLTFVGIPGLNWANRRHRDQPWPALPVSVSDRSEVRLAGGGFWGWSSPTLASDRGSKWFRWAPHHLQWPRNLQQPSKNHVSLYSAILNTHTSKPDQQNWWSVYKKKPQHFFRYGRFSYFYCLPHKMLQLSRQEQGLVNVNQ